LVWKCAKCGKLILHPDEDAEHEDWHETVLCPRCDEPLEAVFFMGDESRIDFLVCPNCKVAYSPTGLRPLANVV
jgi:DNA-directed RNA polymerase subunit RPC12/RpoP